MNKEFIYYLITAVILFISGFSLHSYFASESSLSLRFSIFGVYFYNSVMSILIYLIVKVLKRNGYIYLVLSMIKMCVLVFLYNSYIFSDFGLNKLEKTVLLIPFVMFLFLETIGVVRLLNSTDPTIS